MNFEIVPMPINGPLFEGAIRVYAEAFAEPPYSDPDRGREIRDRLRDVHCRRPGYRAYVALAPVGEVAGMIYGYHGARGQWWHDVVAKKLPKEVGQEWLGDSYELVELAVAPKYQRMAIATGLMHALLEGAKERTCVLSTRTDSEAHQLYAREGFELVMEMQFAAKGATFYVMGKRLR
ncbi:MAG: GNAT family N-acetyltransferase [Anaerolinea sp.]|nr:GNAT family N-acetyltransferase [Anaerolinea sp.]